MGLEACVVGGGLGLIVGLLFIFNDLAERRHKRAWSMNSLHHQRLYWIVQKQNDLLRDILLEIKERK